jgi:murein DD-endopeptidase MepM/ murein hydrolase activator NlpD
MSDHTSERRTERPKHRLLVATLVAALGASMLVSAAHAQPDEGAARQAAREIAAAQDRANEAARQWSEAEAELTRLEDEAAQLEQERATLQAQVDDLRSTVDRAAAERFMSSGNGGIPILTGYQQPLDQLRTAELGRIAAGTSDNAFDQFDVAQRDLQAKADALAAKQDEVAKQRVRYEELAVKADAEVVHLQQVEQQRLADEQVRLALEAQRREEQRRLAAQQAAEAAQRAAEEAERLAAQQAEAAARQAEQDRAAQEQAARAASSQNAAVPVANDVAQAPVPARSQPEEEAEEEGDESAALLVSAAPANPGMICPVLGPTAYSDTWGDGRPGGRRHEGVDMISPHGTPLVAVADGDARFWTNGEGALGVSLTADNGTRYYYGHLSSYEGSDGRVSTGQVIGYVGSTGRTTVNHLHFEVHPGGGAAVNPYPYVRNAGC